jgi:chaperonin GroES
MKLKPLGKRLVVEVSVPEELTSGGFFLPGTVREKTGRGQVLVVGPGIPKGDGSRIALDVKTGDTVFFASDAGITVRIDGQKYLILTESEVLVMIRPDPDDLN